VAFCAQNEEGIGCFCTAAEAVATHPPQQYRSLMTVRGVCFIRLRKEFGCFGAWLASWMAGWQETDGGLR
jgi:hypothetical protein